MPATIPGDGGTDTRQRGDEGAGGGLSQLRVYEAGCF